MPTLPQFEFRLNQILRCMLGKLSVVQAHSFFVSTEPRPICLSRACVRLAEDTLRKGVTQMLATDGAAVERFLSTQNPTEDVSSGRIWERHASDQMGLSFSKNSLELLIWLTAESFVQTKLHPRIEPERYTLGDRLLEWLLATRTGEQFPLSRFLLMPTIQANPLIRLTLPHQLTARFALERSEIPGVETDWAEWFSPQNSWLLEALQSRLAKAVAESDRKKLALDDPAKIRTLGELQTQEAARFLETADSTGRRDLGIFLLRGARDCLNHPIPADRIDVSALTLNERTATYSADLSLFQTVQRLQTWQQEARSAGFYDEGYRASQHWKSIWDALDGDTIAARATELLQSTCII